MGGMMSSMGGGIPGLPQKNDTENDMPSQNIMGMQVPDIMGAAYRGSTNIANRQNKFDPSTAAQPVQQSQQTYEPKQISQTDNMLSKLSQYNPDAGMERQLPTTQNILLNQLGENPITSPKKKSTNPYGLNLGNISNLGLE